MNSAKQMGIYMQWSEYGARCWERCAISPTVSPGTAFVCTPDTNCDTLAADHACQSMTTSDLKTWPSCGRRRLVTGHDGAITNIKTVVGTGYMEKAQAKSPGPDCCLVGEGRLELPASTS